MKTIAIVPAAGYGKRLGLKKRKPFVLLKGKPLVSYALKALNDDRAIDGIIIASERSCVRSFEALVKRYRFGKVIDVVVGGRTRFDSVRNCLAAVDASFDIVLIHDGARPFIDTSVISKSVRLADRYGGCVVAVPESDTVKEVGDDLFIKNTPDRRHLFRAQTPQTFRRDLIKKAYAMAGQGGITDDSSIVEKLGMRVKILKGSYRNIKITTKEDIKLAEVILCGSA